MFVYKDIAASIANLGNEKQQLSECVRSDKNNNNNKKHVSFDGNLGELKRYFYCPDSDKIPLLHVSRLNIYLSVGFSINLHMLSLTYYTSCTPSCCFNQIYLVYRLQNYGHVMSCDGWSYHTAPVNATKPCTNGDVRLAGVLSSNQGRVEICYNNQWGTVCDNSFNNIDASVVCRQLGFPAIGEQVQM